MEGIPFTRAYLESLTTGDLIKMADNLGLDIMDNPDRAFIIRELLDASSKDGDRSAEPREQELDDPVLVEAAPLSKHYNISFIEVMIRDPFWAFVFWENRVSDEEQFEKTPDFNGYYLKISPLEKTKNPFQSGVNRETSGEETSGDETSDGVFTIPVKKEDTARYLGLTNTVGDGISWTEQCQYKIELCASAGGVETVLAASNPIRLPSQPVLPMENQLARLSGFWDFQVIRKSERTLRAKGTVSSNE